MHDHEDPEQRAQSQSFEAQLAQQLERVGVDPRAISGRLRPPEPPVERQISEDVIEVTITVDGSRILETLRGLPDGAGADAFVAAYNALP